jgi:hypothetical protein
MPRDTTAHANKARLLRSALSLSSHLLLSLPSESYLRASRLKPFMHFSLSTRATCPINRTILYFITPIIFRDKHELRSSSLFFCLPLLKTFFSVHWISNALNPCEISESHGGEYKITVFWDVALGSLVKVYRRFRCAYRLHQGDLTDNTAKHRSTVVCTFNLCTSLRATN